MVPFLYVRKHPKRNGFIPPNAKNQKSLSQIGTGFLYFDQPSAKARSPFL